MTPFRSRRSAIVIVAALFFLGVLLFFVGPPGLGAAAWALAVISGGVLGYQRLRAAENSSDGTQ